MTMIVVVVSITVVTMVVKTNSVNSNLVTTIYVCISHNDNIAAAVRNTKI